MFAAVICANAFQWLETMRRLVVQECKRERMYVKVRMRVRSERPPQLRLKI